MYVNLNASHVLYTVNYVMKLFLFVLYHFFCKETTLYTGVYFFLVIACLIIVLLLSVIEVKCDLLKLSA